MPAQKSINDIAFHIGKHTILQPCAEVTIYWRGSMATRAVDLVALYERAMALIGKDLRYFETGTMSGAKPIKPDTLEMLPFWLGQTKIRPDIYMLNLESGAVRNDPSDRSFFFIADEEDIEPAGALKVSLPVETMMDDPDRFVEMVTGLIGNLAFESGHAGFGLNWDPRGDSAMEAQDKMASIAARFWGVDLFDFDVTLGALRATHPAGIKRTGWLTLLGEDVLARIGGREAAERGLPRDCVIRPLSKGVVVRAGLAPSIGDRNSGDAMPAYHAVGALLASTRFVDHQQIFGSMVNDEEIDETQQWLARFDA